MRDASARSWLTLIRVGAIVLGLVATLLLLARIGYWRMFSTFHFYDDEGCILITIKAFIDGHALYDEVFSMYGPLPILLKWALFAATGLPVGHDIGRLISLGYWMATALACGAVAWRLTRSVIAGWVATLFVFRVLGMIVNEPGHPQELCGLLLALVALLATFTGPRPGRREAVIASGLGVVAGCLAMSKINVFVFLMMALGAAALAFTPRTRLVVTLMVFYTVGLLAAPGMLMRHRLDVSLFQHYALHVTLALVPTLILGFGRRSRTFLGLRRYTWFAAGLFGTVGAIAAAVLLCGTTPRGLLEGVLLIPLRVGTHYLILANSFFDGRWPISVAFSVGALAWLVLERAGLAARTVTALLSAAFRVAYGVYFLDWSPPGAVPYKDLFAFALPAAILVLVPRDLAERPVGDAFGRLLLALLAVTESLWAFPVAGSQQAFSTFLATLVLVIVVADGCRDFAAICTQWAWWPTWIAGRLVQAGVVALLLLSARLEADTTRARYEGGVSLGLPGAQAIRVDPGIVRYIQRVTDALRALPDTFLTLPGMYSLYFWTGREPPTNLNLTNWMSVLDDGQQDRIVTQLAARPEVRVVVSPLLVGFWMQGRSLPSSPLVRYIDANFAPAKQLDGVTIWVRQAAPAKPGSPTRLGVGRQTGP